MLVPDEEIGKNLDEAKNVMLHIDKDDIVFIAAALAYPDSIIWSDDSHFERQSRIKAVKTPRLMALLGKK